ncbi:MAG: CDP-alcohol phosphatidyltransferase family protein [Actinomycetota bacterium]|nr:CDP-alcohol phosphatidyltransferase family protein [Actinomycetota bacterium]
MSASWPSIAELREVTQPRDVMGRVNGEHWAGRLYMRHLSPYVTRLLLRTPLSADGVTWLMIASGLVAALVLTVPHPAAALAAALLIQAQLLFDCCDGEVARWRRTMSPAGVYLDRIGHYSTESALVAALGVRVDGGLASIGGWTTLGLVVSVLVLMVKSETDLVHVARAFAGRPLLEDTGSHLRSGRIRGIRAVLRYVPFNRALLAIEFTFLAVVAAGVDAVAGDMTGSRALLVVLVPIAVIVAGGHLLSILSSQKLR